MTGTVESANENTSVAKCPTIVSLIPACVPLSRRSRRDLQRLFHHLLTLTLHPGEWPTLLDFSFSWACRKWSRNCTFQSLYLEKHALNPRQASKLSAFNDELVMVPTKDYCQWWTWHLGCHIFNYFPCQSTSIIKPTFNLYNFIFVTIPALCYVVHPFGHLLRGTGGNRN